MATTRAAGQSDLPFMVHVLRHAAGQQGEPLDVEQCRTSPEVSHYIDGWTPGQGGMICEVDGSPIAAAWLRLLPPEDPGRGFVAPGIPELVIAVAPAHRGAGHGGYLLATLLQVAEDAGVRSTSAFVLESNEPALAMLRRAGFTTVGRRDGGEVMLRVG